MSLSEKWMGSMMKKMLLYNYEFNYNLVRNTQIIHNQPIFCGIQVLTVAVEEAMKG